MSTCIINHLVLGAGNSCCNIPFFNSVVCDFSYDVLQDTYQNPQMFWEVLLVSLMKAAVMDMPYDSRQADGFGSVFPSPLWLSGRGKQHGVNLLDEPQLLGLFS